MAITFVVITCGWFGLTIDCGKVTLLLARALGAPIMMVTFWEGAAAVSWTGMPPLNRI